MSMLNASSPVRNRPRADPKATITSVLPAHRGTVVFFDTCTMPTLFPHVQAAARRVLAANGYEVRHATSLQGCCGAPHDHEGQREHAKHMAWANLGLARETDYIVNTSAGCGAQLREYGDLLQTSAAADFSSRVRDVTELLAAAGPRIGAALDLDVAYDAPCHLQHAQRVHEQPLAMLRSIPGLRVHLLPGYDQCCGSGGLYSFTQPELGTQVLDAKIRAIAEASPRPRYVLTGNPGCIMQIGAGLRAAGLPIEAMHPVELLDWSYQRGGLYQQ
jgi:glycolate oxidase iron-sulfur subunit